MKDQYFGDINDYRKYGLLRQIVGISGLRLLVAWMLTPDDGSTDGKFISYLEDPGKWSRHDPILFQKLKDLLGNGVKRQVRLIESTDLLHDAEYFSSHVPDTDPARRRWLDSLVQRSHSYDFVFLDPDNGLEVKSKAYGKKGSEKYVYWRELKALWDSGKSLLIYQQFIREERLTFIQRIREAVKVNATGSFVEAFSTPNVVFFMALQPDHQGFHEAIVNSIQKNWQEQIQHRELTCTQ